MSVDIVPIERRHIAAFHTVLDSVAREGRYLAFREAPPAARVRRAVLGNLRLGTAQFVAVDGEQLLGWCDVVAKSHECLRHSGTLGMGVLAAHRRRGLGTRLIAATLAAAGQRGLERIELTVRADNAPAIALYHRFGFAIEGRAQRYLRVDGAWFDALLMARLT